MTPEHITGLQAALTCSYECERVLRWSFLQMCKVGEPQIQETNIITAGLHTVYELQKILKELIKDEQCQSCLSNSESLPG